MARWLDDLIGKIFAIDGVDQTQVGRVNFISGAGVSYETQIVPGATPGAPTTLNLTISGGGGSVLETQVDGALDASVERINFIAGEGVSLEGSIDPGDPVTLNLTVNAGPTGTTTTSSVTAGGTGTQNDHIPGGATAAWDAASHWECSTSGLTLTGLAAPSDIGPHFRTIRMTESATALILLSEDASSAEANRFLLPDDESSVQLTHGTWALWYDNTASRWRVLGAIGTEDGALQVVSVTPSTSQNDYAPGGAAAWDRAEVLLVNNSSSITISGFAAPLYRSSPHAKHIYKLSAVANALQLAHASGSSTAANRLLAQEERADVLVRPSEARMLVYDRTTSRWRVSGRTLDHNTLIETTTTGTVDDWVPGGDAAAWDRCTMLGLVHSASTLTINGLAAPLSRKSPHIKIVFRAGIQNATIAHAAGTSAAANRIYRDAAIDTLATVGAGWILMYNDTLPGWQVLGVGAT